MIVWRVQSAYGATTSVFYTGQVVQEPPPPAPVRPPPFGLPWSAVALALLLLAVALWCAGRMESTSNLDPNDEAWIIE